MTKSFYDKVQERMQVIEQYKETFGENSGVVRITDIEETVEIYKHCLEVGKSYEELYGEQPKDAIY